jgi:pyridoxamine 5'-phosphate oxidase
MTDRAPHRPRPDAASRPGPGTPPDPGAAPDAGRDPNAGRPEDDGLDERDLDPNPIRQLERWLADARDARIAEPLAMTVATASAEGHPSARILLLRGLDERGFVFYTNYDSRKGLDLAANPRAALVFHWDVLGRQVRIDGRVERISRGESEEYFASRPAGSRIAAWASEQSRSVAGGRPELEARFRDETARFAGEEQIPLPPFWGGYRVIPDWIEFWHSRENRLHDRLRYRRTTSGWMVERLAP